jgi:hypothetical protein
VHRRRGIIDHFRRRSAYSSIAFALAASTYSAAGRADDAVAAQALFDQGKKALSAHDYGEACPKFEESLRLQPALGTLLNLADCYERQGRLATAWSKFLELAAKAAAAGQTERAKIGKKRAAALVPRLSNLVIAVVNIPPGLEVKRDGTVAGQAEWGTPIPVDPGTHTVEATAPGRQSWSATVVVDEGAKTATVSVPELNPMPASTGAPSASPAPAETGEPLMASPPAPAPRDAAASNRGWGTQKTLALVSAGLGLVGVGVGSYFGFQSISKHNEAENVCPTRTCSTTDGVQLWSDARTAGDRATVAFILGGAALVGGGVLWFTSPSSAPSGESRAQLQVGIGSVRLSGAW